MKEIIRHQNQFYILASSQLTDDRSRVLKHGNTFAVFDRYGDIHPLRFGEPGLYHSGTRYLSRLEFFINGQRPFLLSSNVLDDNRLLAIDLTNPDFVVDGELRTARGTVHIFRSKYLWNGTCYERLRVTNYGDEPMSFPLSFSFENDFADIFEVRGFKRKRRGKIFPPETKGSSITLPYTGLDGLARRTVIRPQFKPDSMSGDTLVFNVALKPRETRSIILSTSCEPENHVLPKTDYDKGYARAEEDRAVIRRGDCNVMTANEQFNDWLNRSYADIHMMITNLPEGLYPYAGVPWFSTVFGRDGIITALQYLWINPDVAKGVLGHLAARQAAEADPKRDAEPGKILHETRKGEMAALGEIPFGLYYGSVDVTPLFVILAGAYYDRTGDLEFIEKIWPNVDAALDWLDRYGDPDKDGFYEYDRRASGGLANQGWKDSENAVFHADGRRAESPIALCEMQGYAYDALRRAAGLAEKTGRRKQAKELRSKAEKLKEKFNETFWQKDLDAYALALDKHKKPCLVRSSNAGQALFSGIAGDDHAARLAASLLSPDFYSGWGVRTVAAGQTGYNPMEYHNGSVWPHDNSLIAWGLARYGHKEAAARILTGLFDASIFLDLHRLPELFCGFDRRPAEGPTLYPVACQPQAWASGSVFLLLQAVLGLSIDGEGKKVVFDHPLLPPYLESVTIKNLHIGENSVDVELRRLENDVSVNVMNKRGDIDVIGIK